MLGTTVLFGKGRPYKKTVERKISADIYLSFGGNKYSRSVKYATRKVHVRLVYGYKIKVESFYTD